MSKPLKYSTEANIPADKQFRGDITSLIGKQNASLWKTFHYRRLERQKNILKKLYGLPQGQ